MRCTTSWCDPDCNGSDHNRIQYTLATGAEPMGEGSVPSVGIGVAYNAIEGVPYIPVHISGGAMDAQADLTWHQALHLRDYLDKAITVLHEILAEGVDLKPAEVR